MERETRRGDFEVILLASFDPTRIICTAAATCSLKHIIFQIPQAVHKFTICTSLALHLVGGGSGFVKDAMPLRLLS